MKKHSNAREDLCALYEAARNSGRVHTQKEFAELLGINPANLSSFMSGSIAITEPMYRRIFDSAALQGITISGSGNGTQDTAGRDIRKTYNEDHTADLLAEMAAQRKLYAEHTHMYFEQIKQLTAALTALVNRK